MVEPLTETKLLYMEGSEGNAITRGAAAEIRKLWDYRQMAEDNTNELETCNAELRAANVRLKEQLSVADSVSHDLVREKTYFRAQVRARDGALDAAEAVIKKLGGDVPARYLT